MNASKTTLVGPPTSPMTNAVFAQHARMVVAHHGERILGEVPRMLRHAGTLLLVLAITIPAFCAGLLIVLWQLAH